MRIDKDALLGTVAQAAVPAIQEAKGKSKICQCDSEITASLGNSKTPSENKS